MNPTMIYRFARTAVIILSVSLGGTALSAYVLTQYGPFHDKMSFGDLMLRWLYSYWWYFAMTSIGGGYFSAYQSKRLKDQEQSQD